MHFHELARCIHCGDLVGYSTPIPSLLILSALCENCHQLALIGWLEQKACLLCIDEADAEPRHYAAGIQRDNFPPSDA